MTKTVDQLLDEARAVLPHRPTPQETLEELKSGTLVLDIRGDEQQRRDGLIPGALVIRRNVLEWRCDPASPWHDPAVTHHGQKIILVCDEGYQSSLAAANLQQLGLSRATDMAGGFSHWKQLALPVTPYDELAVKPRWDLPLRAMWRQTLSFLGHRAPWQKQTGRP